MEDILYFCQDSFSAKTIKMTQTDGHFMSQQTIILLQIVLLDIKEALILFVWFVLIPGGN